MSAGLGSALSSGVVIFEVPGCHLLWQMSSQWGSQKFLQGLVSHELKAYHSVFNLFLPHWIMATLSKGCQPDNFQPHNSLKLSFTNIGGFCSNFIESESFLESNSPDILALCKTNLDDSIDSSNFSMRGYLPLIQKDSVTHMHGLAVYVKEWLLFMGLISRKLCRFLLMFSTSFNSISVLLLFPLSVTFFIIMQFLILFHLT